MDYPNLVGKSVLIVEDDPSMIERLQINLEDIGCRVLIAEDVITAENIITESLPIDFAILDFYIPEIVGQRPDRVMRGEELAYTIRKRSPKTKIIGISANFETSPSTPLENLLSAFIYKNNFPLGKAPIILFETMDGILVTPNKKMPRIFIVHGHDNEYLYELKDYLQNTLKLGEPIVLREKVSSGKTLIEKFEKEAKDNDIVFVLMTPDDAVKAKDSSEIRRSRQNVIFEMGFFYAKLQRTSGRILLLKKGEIELPSDILGIVDIDISNGIFAAGEIIRGELTSLGWLKD